MLENESMPAVTNAAGKRVVRIAEMVLGAIFLGVLALSFANVVLRYVFSSALLFGDELEVLTLIVLTFLGAIVVTLRQQHLRMEIFSDVLPGGIRVVLGLFEALLTILVCGFAAWQSWSYAMLMMKLHRKAEMIDIPTWPFHFSLVLGWTAISLITAYRLVRLLRTRGASTRLRAGAAEADP